VSNPFVHILRKPLEVQQLVTGAGLLMGHLCTLIPLYRTLLYRISWWNLNGTTPRSVHTWY